MERNEFLNEMMKLFHDESKQLSKDEVNSIIQENINTLKDRSIKDGCYNLVIVMEELAELSQAISKVLRGKEDRTNLIEELADVSICIEYIKSICDINQDELDRAISVKAKRLQEKFNTSNQDKMTYGMDITLPDDGKAYIKDVNYVGPTTESGTRGYIFTIDGKAGTLFFEHVDLYPSFNPMEDINIVCIYKNRKFYIQWEKRNKLGKEHPGFMGYVSRDKYYEILHTITTNL